MERRKLSGRPNTCVHRSRLSRQVRYFNVDDVLTYVIMSTLIGMTLLLMGVAVFLGFFAPVDYDEIPNPFDI